MGLETLAIASIGASILGAGVGAMGAMSSGDAALQASQYRAGVARNMAEASIAKGNIDNQRYGMKLGQMQGQQRAGYGAGGIRTDWGSAADVATSTTAIGRMDEATIMYNAALKAAGLQDEATLSLMEGQSKQTESRYRAMTSILGGAESVSSRWMNFSNARSGVFS
jgi:hypothetical protein